MSSSITASSLNDCQSGMIMVPPSELCFRMKPPNISVVPSRWFIASKAGQ